jgi:succinate dehydrogenase / fumarate reductase membrane anchor subunit
MASPFNAVLLILLTVTMVYHSQLGLQVVIEDYVAHPGLKIVTLLLIEFVHVALAAFGLFAVLKIAFLGGWT